MNDFGPNRGGFGGGFQGKGHMPPHQNSWKHKEGGATEEKEKMKNMEEAGSKEGRPQDSDLVRARWEGNRDKQVDKQSSWGDKGAGASS